MIRKIEVTRSIALEAYACYAHLTRGVRDLQQEAALLVPRIGRRKIWMVNSTEHGGGVAEMMPGMIDMFRQLGLSSEWVVADTNDQNFFHTTKKIHNLIHGEAGENLSEDERTNYEYVNRKNAEELLSMIADNDIVVINDPQPMAMARYMGAKDPVLIWRCHIGSDNANENTEKGWSFLKAYGSEYKLALFSAPEYIPSFLAGKASVLYPSIDPLDHKNRELPVNKLVGILCNGNLLNEYHPVLTPPFPDGVKRLQPDGSFQSALLPSELGLLFSPCILQVSRWDRLKGFLPLMKGFEILKKSKHSFTSGNERHLRELELAILVLAGPDPLFIEDDPQGAEVLNELVTYYMTLPRAIQADISILKIPMTSRKYNELIINALQRVSTIVVQNSIREGFGLTVTEAMWKGKPVIGSNACGIRNQIRNNIDGRLISDPEDPESVAIALNYALENHIQRQIWELNATKKAIENFLIFSQVSRWLRIFANCGNNRAI